MKNNIDMDNIINISWLAETISKAVKEKLNESYSINEGLFEDDVDASSDFFDNAQYEFEKTLSEKLPGHEFEFDCERDGEVTALDTTTGKYYKGTGEVEYESRPLGRPSSHNPYEEAEGPVAYFDFTNALRMILQKIDEDKPDGQEEI